MPKTHKSKLTELDGSPIEADKMLEGSMESLVMVTTDNKVIKYPYRAIKEMKSLLDDTDFDVYEYANRVIVTLADIGVLLPTNSRVKNISIDNIRRVCFEQDYDPQIEDINNHHTGDLPIIGNIGLQIFARVRDVQGEFISVFFDWDSALVLFLKKEPNPNVLLEKLACDKRRRQYH